MDPLFVSLAALTLAGSAATPGSVSTVTDQPQTGIAAEAAAQMQEKDPLEQFYDILWTRKYADALAFASSIHPDNPEGRAMVNAMRAAALMGLKRDSEVHRLIDEAERLAPGSTDATRIAFIGAIVSDRMEFGADALDRLIDRAPDIVRSIDTDTMGYFFQEEPKGDVRRNQDRRIALARIGYASDTPTGHYIAGVAVDLLVRRGDIKGAEALLPYILDPQTIEDMLITRRYQSLWPGLEKIAGPHLELVRKASVGRRSGPLMKCPIVTSRWKISSTHFVMRGG